MGRRVEKLDETETVTFDHYDQNTEAFWKDAKDHNVTRVFQDRSLTKFWHF